MERIGFDYFASLNPTAPALVDPQHKSWSRGELASLVNRLSRALRASDVSRGDVVAIIAPNCAEYVASYLAATQIGAYLVPINWHISASEIAYILADCEAKVIVAHERFASAALRATQSAAECTRVAIGEAAGFNSLYDYVAAYSDLPLPDAVAGRPMFYTSATTGLPKGVVLSLPESFAALERVIRLHIQTGIALEQGNVHLCASMLYHGAPLEAATIALHMGHCVVIVDRWDPEMLLQLVERYTVTTTVMVPTMFVRMLKLPAHTRARYDTRSLRRVIHTGAACPVEVKRQMIDWWGPLLWETYGAAEGAGTIVNSEEWLRFPGTVGRPIPGSDFLILDEDGHEQPRGIPGTIYFTRYTGDSFQYKGDPAKTAACHRGRFFSVGDIGYLNEENYLFICDRSVDMIISGGMNIYAAEIERVLILHPEVADCAVFATPDELLGEAVTAVIQPLPGVPRTRQLSFEIMQFLRKHLAPIKLPKRIEYLDELPRAPNGKLYKRRLRELEFPKHSLES